MRAAVVVLLVMLVAAACGNGAGDDGAGAANGDAIRGRTFLSTDVEGHDLVAGTELRMTFNDDATLGASAGCNQFVGELSIEDDVLVVTNLGGTEMGCDEERHAQDEWFTAFLGDRPRYTLADDGSLTLSGGAVTIELLDRKVAEPDLPLVGTRWTVDTILEGDAASSVPQGSEATLTFGDDGRVTGNDGCNDFSVAFADRGGALSFGTREGTKAACPSADVQRLADAVAAATTGDVTVDIDAKRLTLTDAAGRGVSAVGG